MSALIRVGTVRKNLSSRGGQTASLDIDRKLAPTEFLKRLEQNFLILKERNTEKKDQLSLAFRSFKLITDYLKGKMDCPEWEQDLSEEDLASLWTALKNYGTAVCTDTLNSNADYGDPYARRLQEINLQPWSLGLKAVSERLFPVRCEQDWEPILHEFWKAHVGLSEIVDIALQLF